MERPCRVLMAKSCHERNEKARRRVVRLLKMRATIMVFLEPNRSDNWPITGLNITATIALTDKRRPVSTRVRPR